jgi:hypothetical protein
MWILIASMDVYYLILLPVLMFVAFCDKEIWCMFVYFWCIYALIIWYSSLIACKIINWCKHFGGTCCLHLKSDKMTSRWVFNRLRMLKWVNYVGRLQVAWPIRMMQRGGGGGGTGLVLAFPLCMVSLATFLAACLYNQPTSFSLITSACI